MSGYYNGLAAEDVAARWYTERGAECVAKRWRAQTGEVDLIVRQAGVLVFVEVKARKTIDAAAYSISPRQWARITATAEMFLAENNLSLDTDLRFDAALLDRHGKIEVIENAAPY